MTAPAALSSPSLDDGEVLYLYALMPSGTAPVQHEGLGEAPVQTVALTGDVWAVVDVVPREPWAGADADANLQSLAWVAPRATRHEEVVETLLDDGLPVYPARFGTLFSGVERLRETAAAHDEALREHFERVATATEWAVKVLVDRDEAAARIAESGESDTDAPGTAYLLRRKRERDAREDVDHWLDGEYETVLADLAPHADAHRELDARDRPDDAREVAVHWAFLVDDAAIDAFLDVVDAHHDRLAPHGAALDCTGPWPPYSFRPALSSSDSS